MKFEDVWNDPVWSKVIGGLIVVTITGVASKLSGWPKKIWTPVLRKTDAYSEDQSGVAGISFPLKYYIEVVNDSRKSVAVRLSGYQSKAVTLQKFVPDTLQLMMPDGWHPRPNTAEIVAALPNQRCRCWIGVDATKFTKADVERLKGNIGTVTLTANGKRIPFEL